MNSDNSNELLPVVDTDGRRIGTATRGECHSGISKPLHPVVHLHLFDPEGRLYLQRRPEWKDIQPGKWDTAVGGHVDPDESIEEALRREAREELGIEGFNPEALTTYVFESDRERELVNTIPRRSGTHLSTLRTKPPEDGSGRWMRYGPTSGAECSHPISNRNLPVFSDSLSQSPWPQYGAVRHNYGTRTGISPAMCRD